MSRNEKESLAAVDALLKTARDAPADVSDALMARVLADAEGFRPVMAPPRQPGIWERLADLVGGWQGMGGLVAATCVGVWIGLSPPDALPDAGAYLLGYETVELMTSTAELTSFGWDVEEE